MEGDGREEAKDEDAEEELELEDEDIPAEEVTEEDSECEAEMCADAVEEDVFNSADGAETPLATASAPLLAALTDPNVRARRGLEGPSPTECNSTDDVKDEGEEEETEEKEEDEEVDIEARNVFGVAGAEGPCNACSLIASLRGAFTSPTGRAPVCGAKGIFDRFAFG